MVPVGQQTTNNNHPLQVVESDSLVPYNLYRLATNKANDTTEMIDQPQEDSIPPLACAQQVIKWNGSVAYWARRSVGWRNEHER